MIGAGEPKAARRSTIAADPGASGASRGTRRLKALPGRYGRQHDGGQPALCSTSVEQLSSTGASLTTLYAVVGPSFARSSDSATKPTANAATHASVSTTSRVRRRGRSDWGVIVCCVIGALRQQRDR